MLFIGRTTKRGGGDHSAKKKNHQRKKVTKKYEPLRSRGLGTQILVVRPLEIQLIFLVCLPFNMCLHLQLLSLKFYHFRGKFVSSRRYPQMALIQPKVQPVSLFLTELQCTHLHYSPVQNIGTSLK